MRRTERIMLKCNTKINIANWEAKSWRRRIPFTLMIGSQWI